MEKNKNYDELKKHIKEIRKSSNIADDKEFKIALGKVICEMKIAKSKGNDHVLQDIFSLK